jgi:excisionase family DNA binding protein
MPRGIPLFPTLLYDVCTNQEAADMLDVNKARINQLIRAGKLRARLSGKTYLIYKPDIDRYKINRRTFKSKPGVVKPDAE